MNNDSNGQVDSGKMESSGSKSFEIGQQSCTPTSDAKVSSQHWFDGCRSSMESLDDAYPHADFYRHDAGGKTSGNRPSLVALHAHDRQVVTYVSPISVIDEQRTTPSVHSFFGFPN